MGKGKKFSRHDLIEAVDAGNTIAERDDCADFVYRNLGLVILDLLAD